MALDLFGKPIPDVAPTKRQRKTLAAEMGGERVEPVAKAKVDTQDGHRSDYGVFVDGERVGGATTPVEAVKLAGEWFLKAGGRTVEIDLFRSGDLFVMENFDTNPDAPKAEPEKPGLTRDQQHGRCPLPDGWVSA